MYIVVMAETMYAMKPVFELDSVVSIPSCMYSLPVIQASNHIPGVGSGHGSGVSSGDQDIRVLEARQDAIISRLEKLKADVEAYKQSLGLTTGTVAATSTEVKIIIKKQSLTCLRLITLHYSQLSVFPSIVDTDSTLQRLEKLKVSINMIEAIFNEPSHDNSSKQTRSTGSKNVLV